MCGWVVLLKFKNITVETGMIVYFSLSLFLSFFRSSLSIIFLFIFRLKYAITGFRGKNRFRIPRHAFPSLVVIFHFISLREGRYIYSFSNDSREILKRSRAVTFREMRSGSSGEDWLSTMKLYKFCIAFEYIYIRIQHFRAEISNYLKNHYF